MAEDNPLRFAFTSTLIKDPDIPDGYMKHYVPIPDDVADELAASGVTHVEGDLDGHTFRRVINRRDDGVHCLMFGMTWLKQAGLEVDMNVIIELSPDPDPERVDVPDELMAALNEEPHLINVWQGLAPSRRKMLGYHVERAKKLETRQRRVQGILKDLRGMLTTRSDD